MINWDALVIQPLVDKVFGEPFTWSLQNGAYAFLANAVYDEEYQEEVLNGAGVPIMTTGPAVGIRLADFPTMPRQGDQCTCIRTGVTFQIQRPRPDSHGHVFMKLNALGAAQ